MLHLPLVDIAGTRYQLHELTFGETIKVARIAERLNEHRITAFLGYALKDAELPLNLPVQVRYALLIHYLSSQTDTLTGLTLDYAAYLQQGEWVESCDGVRQMTGLQAEVLESACEDVVDWLTGAMAIQMHDMPDDRQGIDDALRQQVHALHDLPSSAFDAQCDRYLIACQSMASHVKTGFDTGGFVVFGGTDDAPLRFCPSTAFGRHAKQLARHLTVQSAEIGD